MFVQKCSVCVIVFFVYILGCLNKSKKKKAKKNSKESAVYTIQELRISSKNEAKNVLESLIHLFTSNRKKSLKVDL